MNLENFTVNLILMLDADDGQVVSKGDIMDLMLAAGIYRRLDSAPRLPFGTFVVEPDDRIKELLTSAVHFQGEDVAGSA